MELCWSLWWWFHPSFWLSRWDAICPLVPELLCWLRSGFFEPQGTPISLHSIRITHSLIQSLTRNFGKEREGEGKRNGEGERERGKGGENLIHCFSLSSNDKKKKTKSGDECRRRHRGSLIGSWISPFQLVWSVESVSSFSCLNGLFSVSPIWSVWTLTVWSTSSK